jgi:2-methylcitrate dehydratase PrpD
VLHAAAVKQYTSAETVQLLLDAGVGAAARDSNGYTSLDSLCLYGKGVDTLGKCSDASLHDREAEVSACSSYYCCCYCDAAVQAVQALLDHGHFQGKPQ